MLNYYQARDCIPVVNANRYRNADGVPFIYNSQEERIDINYNVN